MPASDTFRIDSQVIMSGIILGVAAGAIPALIALSVHFWGNQSAQFGILASILIMAVLVIHALHSPRSILIDGTGHVHFLRLRSRTTIPIDQIESIKIAYRGHASLNHSRGSVVFNRHFKGFGGFLQHLTQANPSIKVSKWIYAAAEVQGWFDENAG